VIIFSQIFPFCPYFFKIENKNKKFGGWPVGEVAEPPPWAMGVAHHPQSGPMGHPQFFKKKLGAKWKDLEKNYYVRGTCSTFHPKRWNWVTEYSNCKIL
jgi:hypothetical protein